MRVLLVDDNRKFLIGLRNLLEVSGISVVGAALTAEDAIELAQIAPPDVVLMDIEMPGASGIEATAVIRELLPAVQVVMMTVSEREEYLFEAIRAGACGYLLKGLTMDRFSTALEELARGEMPLSPGLAGRIMVEFRRRERERELQAMPRDVELSAEERLLLALAAEGKSYAEMAAESGLNASAIRFIFRGIADKLHLESRAHVLAHASRLMPRSKPLTTTES